MDGDTAGDPQSPAAATLVVRPTTADDHLAIRRVVADAFGSDAEADLVERIRASHEYEPSMDLVAMIDDRVVGHVMISRAMLRSDTDRSIAMLSPLAVTPALHRRGIGSALVRAVTAIANDRNEPLIVLEGNPAYYSRLGFEPAAAYDITMPLPGWAPVEAAQVMVLSAYQAGAPDLRGTVEYSSAFDGLE